MGTAAILFVYVCGFGVGTVCHLLDIVRGGWLPYKTYGMGLNLFWTMLTFLDPLAIALLVYLRRAGVWLAVVIMALDVAVNVTVGVGEYLHSGRFTFWGLYTQIPFGIFVFLTARTLAKSQDREGSAPLQEEGR